MESPTHDFPHLADLVRQHGVSGATDRFIAELQDGRDPTALFYALLLKARLALGVSPYPMGPASDLPSEVHEQYELAIRDAARTTGALLIARNDIARAWPFYRLINEPEPIRQAIEAYQPGEDDDVYPVIDVAWQQGVAPQHGFDLMLARQGICSTITMLSQTDLSKQPALRDSCLGKLVNALHVQLRERIIGDLTSRGKTIVEPTTIPGLIAQHPDLSEGDAYHVDLSHLQSVVQMGTVLSDGPALRQLIELCDYGRRLSKSLAFTTDPPFDEGHADYHAFYETLAGINVDANVARFRRKADEAMTEGMTYPCHILIDLLTRIGREREALTVAQELFAGLSPAETGGISVMDLARKVNDHAAVAEAAKQANDPITYLAALANHPVVS